MKISKECFFHIPTSVLKSVAFLVVGFVAIFCFDRLISLDRIRHKYTDRIHIVSQEQIIQVLDCNLDRNAPNLREVSNYINLLVRYCDDDLTEFKDSLLFDFEKYIDYNTCLELYRDALSSPFPQSVKAYLLDKTLELAESKYETILTILYYYKDKKDVDGLLATYDLVKSWKWDRDYLKGVEDDHHNFDYFNAIQKCMEFAVISLEEVHTPVTDSIARVIIGLSNTGLKACSELYHDGEFHPIEHFFAEKRVLYAYRLNDHKADKYADYYIDKSLNSLNYSIYYHYLAVDWGGDILGYQNKFFSDPLFLRYKSCLEQKEYKRARELLNVIQSNTSDGLQDPKDPYYSFHNAIQVENRSVLDIALPYAQYDLATISENARLRFLTQDGDFSKWANGSFITGAWYMSPTEGFTERTIDYLFNENLIPSKELSKYMAINYNNPDARWVYNTALYLKGATTKISQAIEKAIVYSRNEELIEGIKAIKREHVFTSQLDKKAERYVAINESVETLLGAKMKKALSDCFYSFTDIKSSLSKNECAIEFVKAPSLSFGDDVYKAVLLRSDWEEPKMITLTSSANVNDYYITGNYYSSTSSKLYTYVWKPLEKYLSPQDVIYIAPDGVLSLVNFGAILNDKGECLSDIYNLHQCISTKSIKDREQEQEVKSIALFGGMNYDEIADVPSITYSTSLYRSPDNRPSNSVFEPLSGTQKEIEEIQAKAESNGIYSRSFSGKEGTEYNFKDLTGSSESIIHVATHGFYYSSASTKDLDFFEMIFVDDNPYDRCGLVFSGGNIAWRGEHIPDYMEDGILLGSEIARMDLSSTDLVVLSACNTGLGDIGKEGVAGLQMAFKQAGVKSMLMTLGKVDDEATAYFMTNFYERLFNGEDEYSAYHAAINAMRESERFSDSKYWSQFILID